jgi:hypothetical protein
VYAASLLDHVRSLVGRGVQIWWTCEGDVLAARVRGGADIGAGVRRLATDVSVDAAQVVLAERGLDGVQEWQRHAALAVDVGALVCARHPAIWLSRWRAARATPLHEPVGLRAFAGREGRSTT